MLFLLTSAFLALLPLRPARAIQWQNFFINLAVFWLHFGTLKGSNGFLAFVVPRLGPKKPLKLIREIPQKY